MKELQPAIYIMTNQRNGTLYIGVTSNLIKRVYEHRESLIPSFTKKYGCNQLVYYEPHESIIQAIIREKQLKGGSRKKKISLIERFNPKWRDLYDSLI